MNFIYYLPSGQITRRTSGMPAASQGEERYLEYHGTVDLAVSYVQDGQIVSMPPRPSEFHEFDFAMKQWVPNTTWAWSVVRYKRNQLLQECDWTQLTDVPIDTKEAWATYRQALRDVTAQSDPFNIVWPAPPA